MRSTLTHKHVIISEAFGKSEKPWAARLVGIDDERGFDREFMGVSHSVQDAATGHKTATVKLPRVESNIYELGKWKSADDGEEIRYYLQIVDDAPRLISQSDARAALARSTEPEEDIDLPF
jgi:hypothetical protein